MMSKMMIIVHASLASISLCAAASYGSAQSMQQLTVVTNANPPFVTKETDGTFTGYLPELIGLVAGELGASYTIIEQPDRVSGALQSDGTWNGMVGSLIAKRADVAAGLTMTAAREAVIDFPTPYAITYRRILVNAATPTPLPATVHYQVVRDSADAQFLQRSTNPDLQAVWADILANNGLVANPQAGIANVLAEGNVNVVFVGDDNILEAAVAANPGQLRIDPRILLTEGLAFGVQQGSDLRRRMAIAICTINDSGRLQVLLDKYGIRARPTDIR